MDVVLYSNDCPQCKLLKSKLDSKNISYIIERDFKDIIQEGFKSLPVLKIDEIGFLDFRKAVEWVNTK